MAPGPLHAVPANVPRMVTQASDLTRLIETEARLDQQLEVARDEARRLVAEARAFAASRAGRLAGEAEAARVAARARLAAEEAAAMAGIEADAGHQAARYADLGERQLDALARKVVAALLAGAPP